MKFDTIYLIPTYNRYDKLLHIIKTIKSFSENNLIIINNDASTDKRYAILKDMNGVDYIEEGVNGGKTYFYRTITSLFDRLKKYEYEKVCVLQDDFLLSTNFEQELNNFDSKKILRLFLGHESNWGLKHWVDGVFVCGENFIKDLGYKVPPQIIPTKTSSSGVGKYLSNKIMELGYVVEYRGALLKHIGNYDSKMHANLRREEPLNDDLDSEWL